MMATSVRDDRARCSLYGAAIIDMSGARHHALLRYEEREREISTQAP